MDEYMQKRDLRKILYEEVDIDILRGMQTGYKI